ncbi:MAG: DUF4332 domain-containing protein [Chloroflexota bacterium]
MRKLTGLQWIIVLLTLATAIIHLFLGASSWGSNTMMGAMFALDGIGYIVILALLYFSGRTGSGRSTMRWILIFYTLLTIILYFVVNGSSAFSNTLGLITKAIEAVLVILLFLDRGSDTVEVAAPAAVSTASVSRAATEIDTTATAAAAGAAAAVAGAVAAADDKVNDAADAVGDMATRSMDAIDDAVDSTTRMSREALLSFFGDIDSMTEDEWRAKLLEHLNILGDTTQFDQPIEYIEGIGEVFGRKWRAVDVTKAIDLLVLGATRKGRAALSKKSGFTESQILTWTNQVDLYRIKGVAQEYADLLEQSGVDTVVELAARNPENLQKRMVEVNDQKKLVRRNPNLSEVEKWVDQARQLPRVMHY